MARIQTDNRRARALLEALGFQLERRGWPTSSRDGGIASLRCGTSLDSVGDQPKGT